MAKGDIDDVDAAFARQHEPAPDTQAKPPQSEATRRAHVERRASEPKDARSLRYIGRSVQLNVRVRPEVKEALTRASDDFEAPITYIIEQAVNAWIAAQERKKGARS